MKITFHATGCVPPETMERNTEYGRSLGLPSVTSSASRRLAVIGGGPSLRDHLDELRLFDGDRWIIGTAFAFCRDNGIDGAFFDIDPQPLTEAIDIRGVRKAVLATCVDQSFFDALRAGGAEIEVFDLIMTAERANHGSSTVTAAPELALTVGYIDITFYGCEGSLDDAARVGDAKDAGPMRAYESEEVGRDRMLRVACNGEAFLTVPEFLLQCEFLATMLRMFPALYRERCGGLLRAMVADADYDITHCTRKLVAELGLTIPETAKEV